MAREGVRQQNAARQRLQDRDDDYWVVMGVNDQITAHLEEISVQLRGIYRLRTTFARIIGGLITAERPHRLDLVHGHREMTTMTVNLLQQIDLFRRMRSRVDRRVRRMADRVLRHSLDDSYIQVVRQRLDRAERRNANLTGREAFEVEANEVNEENRQMLEEQIVETIEENNESSSEEEEE